MKKDKVFTLGLLIFGALILGAAVPAGAAGKSVLWCREMMKEAGEAQVCKHQVAAQALFVGKYLSDEALVQRTPEEIRKCFRVTNTPMPSWIKAELKRREEAARRERERAERERQELLRKIPEGARWLFEQ